MYIVSRSELIKSTPDRWFRQYKNYEYGSSSFRHREKCDELSALKWPFSAEDVNKIIGNDSWTIMKCDECKMDAEELVHLGDEVDYDATYADVCFECLNKAAKMLVST